MYSEDELIEEIKRVSEEHCDGGSPTWRDFEEYGFCDPETISNRFGSSWNNALEAAGLESNKQKSREQWTKEELIEEIKTVSEEKYDGDVPSCNDITAHYQRFGTWEELVQEAGFDETRKRENRVDKNVLKKEVKQLLENSEYPFRKDVSSISKYSEGEIHAAVEKWDSFLLKCDIKEKLLEEIIEKSSDGKLVTRKEMDNNGICSPSIYAKWFGSWRNAIKAAGLKPRNNGVVVSEEELANEYHRVCEEYNNGEPAPYKQIEKYCKYSITAYKGEYGDLESMREELGYDAVEHGMKGVRDEDHPNWKEDSYNNGIYYGSSWTESLKQRIRERDGMSCEACSLSNTQHKDIHGFQLEVHHITPMRYSETKSYTKDELNSPSNLITLCRSCHNKLERKWTELTQQEFSKRAKEHIDKQHQQETKGIFDY